MKVEKFHITNYRSLVDFKVDAFDSTTIFYGLNNAGKSNIISALHTIFKRKPQYNQGVLGGPINFYTGILPDFTSNFFNQNDSLVIDFSVELSALQEEFIIAETIKKIFKPAVKKLALVVNGQITKSKRINGAAEIQLTTITVNGTTIYNSTNAFGPYFPSLIKKDRSNVSELGEAFTFFADALNDCVYVIGSGRDMHPITITHDGIVEEINPKTFKKFLHSLYLSEEDHHLFEEINRVFNAEPFGFGTISFAHINDHLEIMIKEGSIRLPIQLVGSGLLQILYIITGIVYNQSKIVCIEELEQNLSPKLQNLALRKLQSMLATTSADQIIISSHSTVFAKQKLSGSIYLIEKKGEKTVVTEKIGAKYGKAAKAHFIPAAVPAGTFTDKEVTDYLDENTKKMVEARFKD